jgi:hypothetical protein
MPTPNCHSLSHIVGSMFQTTADKAAFVAAAAIGSSPFWRDYFQHVNDAAVLLGPPLAAVFVTSKIALTWIQIARALWRREKDE